MEEVSHQGHVFKRYILPLPLLLGCLEVSSFHHTAPSSVFSIAMVPTKPVKPQLQILLLRYRGQVFHHSDRRPTNTWVHFWAMNPASSEPVHRYLHPPLARHCFILTGHSSSLEDSASCLDTLESHMHKWLCLNPHRLGSMQLPRYESGLRWNHISEPQDIRLLGTRRGESYIGRDLKCTGA